jgi:excisionase family DNA binding protein
LGNIEVSVRANHMRVEELLDLINRERHEALDVRDPIAIALAAERYNTLAGALSGMSPTEVMDLYKPVLSVSQAAKILGYNAKEVRRLLGQGKLSGKKVNNQWRIPLKAVL